MKTSGKYPSSCEDMMQEIAEASVESILTGIDPCEHADSTPDTPPTTHSSAEHSCEWYSPSLVNTPFSSQPSWSFCEMEGPTNQFRSEFVSQVGTRQISSSIYTPSEDSGSQADAGGGGCTTVMLRNIPNKYTRSGLLAALVERGFDPTADCNNLYLPMDAGSGCNLGYAFLNFTSHEKATEFMQQFDGCRLPSAGSRKVCSVVWANKQGLFQHSNPPTSKEQTTPGSGHIATTVVDCIPTCKIFVGGLPVTTTEADLVEYFGKYGQVREASIVMNRQTGSSRGFGFCEFTSPDAVERVQFAQSRRPHSINCRVVSVRPYTMHQVPNHGGIESSIMPMHQAAPATMTFLMGNGMIHYPANSGSIAAPSAYSSTYGHPLLNAPGVVAPQIHQSPFISY
jgi:RNA recognition motif-containing protein